MKRIILAVFCMGLASSISAVLMVIFFTHHFQPKIFEQLSEHKLQNTAKPVIITNDEVYEDVIQDLQKQKSDLEKTVKTLGNKIEKGNEREKKLLNELRAMVEIRNKLEKTISLNEETISAQREDMSVQQEDIKKYKMEALVNKEKFEDLRVNYEQAQFDIKACEEDANRITVVYDNLRSELRLITRKILQESDDVKKRLAPYISDIQEMYDKQDRLEERKLDYYRRETLKRKEKKKEKK